MSQFLDYLENSLSFNQLLKNAEILQTYES